MRQLSQCLLLILDLLTLTILLQELFVEDLDGKHASRVAVLDEVHCGEGTLSDLLQEREFFFGIQPPLDSSVVVTCLWDFSR